MKTRRQIKETEEEKPVEKKKTKTQIMKEKAEALKAEKGKQEAKKKVKGAKSKSTPKEPSPEPVKKGRGRKAKQVRVKPSPPKPLSKTLESLAEKAKPEQKTKKQRGGSKKSVRTPSPSPPRKKQAKSPEKENVKTIIMKGKVPIDDYFPLDKKQYHVLEHQGKTYSATLNQTNMKNNNNKFYVIQVLQSDTNSNNCYYFTRWGRVGVPGQNANSGSMPINHAIMNFDSKYRDKTRPGGGYVEIQMNYGDDEDEKKEEQKKDEEKEADQEKSSKPKPTSKLPKTTQSLIELIFDLNMMNQQMKQIGFNVNKMPLGKLSKESIMRGYEVLKELYEELKLKKPSDDKILDMSGRFFTFIPHDFGFTHMRSHVLNTSEKVKAKIEMLETLSEIKVATTLLSEGVADDKISKIDNNYAKLNRKVIPVNHLSTEFETIEKYLQSTHGRHHTSYTMELVDLFKLDSEKDNARYTQDIGNKMLLWHGSRLTNYVGILSQGLRIAPPQAPVTGYMFGKGVYFADMSSKSANYCFTSRENNTGILLLCEVALGGMNEKIHADYYAANLPPGKESTKGVGKIAPDPKKAVELERDVMIPMGPGIESNDPTLYLRYNEFIVYDVAQIKIKYLLRTKFNYSNGGFYP